MNGLTSKSSIAGATLTAVELVGDVSLKYYAETNNPALLGVGVASYLGLTYVLQDALRTEKLAVVNGYWDAYSNLLTSGVAIGVLGEQVSMQQVVGLVLIGGGLFLL
jgi:multidrug transporter EmrE-like cation transporter